MKNDWLWDRKVNISEARKILRHPENERFVLMASLLLARKAEPREVFKDYIDPMLFCKNWQRIKKRMGQDKWANPRIIFWQAIYEKLIDRYRKKGIKIMREKKAGVRDYVCETIGKEMRKVRKEEGLSQKELAQKAGVAQQMISRVEKGKENISLITLKKISESMGRKVEINFKLDI